MGNVLRLRADAELLCFRGYLLVDGPVRLLLHDGTSITGIALSCTDASMEFLDASGAHRRYRHAQVLEALPLEPGEAYDAVVRALETGGHIVEHDEEDLGV